MSRMQCESCQSKGIKGKVKEREGEERDWVQETLRARTAAAPPPPANPIFRTGVVASQEEITREVMRQVGQAVIQQVEVPRTTITFTPPDPSQEREP